MCLLLSNRSGILHCKCVTVTTTMNVSSTSTGLLLTLRSLLNPATFLLLTVHYEVFNFVWLRRFSELKLARWHSRPMKSTARASVNHKAATEYQFGIQSQQHPSWIVIISFVCLQKPLAQKIWAQNWLQVFQFWMCHVMGRISWVFVNNLATLKGKN